MSTITISTPEKLIVSENGTGQQSTPESSSKIEKLLKSNISLAVWLVFLAFGGGILALYYARIGYLPDIEWKAALVYLFIGSIVGGVIGLLLIISVYLPGLIWSESIVLDRCLKFVYDSPHGKQAGKDPAQEVCIRTIFTYLGLPFFLVLLFSHIALLAGKVGYWLIAIGLLWLTFVVVRIRFRYRLAKNSNRTTQDAWSYLWSNLTLRNKEEKDDAYKAADRHAFKLSSAFTLSVLLNQISMYIVYWLSGTPSELQTFAILTILCTSGVWIASHVVALRHGDHPRQALVAALIAAGLLLFTADNFSSLSMRLMNHFGIGYNQRVNLLMTDHGGEIVRELGVQSCGKLQLCNVEILSKVGEQYFLRIDNREYLTLPKSDVVAVRSLN